MVEVGCSFSLCASQANGCAPGELNFDLLFQRYALDTPYLHAYGSGDPKRAQTVGAHKTVSRSGEAFCFDVGTGILLRYAD